MKLQCIALPAVTLLASVTAYTPPDVPEVKDLNDCFWGFLYGQDIAAFCPQPKKKGDAYSTSSMSPGDCIALVDGQIHPADK